MMQEQTRLGVPGRPEQSARRLCQIDPGMLHSVS